MLDNEIIALSSEMGALDREACTTLAISTKELMHNAAFAFSTFLLQHEIINNVQEILIVCGNGNNGGDGYALALILAEKGYTISIYTVEPDKGRNSNAQYWFEKCFEKKKAKIAYDFDDALKNTDMIIDAVYGTGFHDSFNPQVEEIFKKMSLYNGKKVAIDIPSGVNADTAAVCPHAFKADLTITFEFLKLGLVSAPACAFSGEVAIVPIGFPDDVRQKMFSIGRRYVLSDPLEDYKRNPESNKGDYGKLLSICGSQTMTGASYLAAMGALRTGIGLMYFCCPSEIMQVMQVKLNEPVFMPYKAGDLESFKSAVGNLDNYSAILHGCGVGTTHITASINEYLLLNAKNPCVFDADALNALVGQLDILHEKSCKLILTPHPKEMARLIGKDVDYVQKNRFDVAKDFAAKYNCALILKGAKTLIAMPEGKVYVNSTVNAGMAKGGSGDILAGMVASLVGQHFPIARALCSAVFKHGRSGDLCREVHGENAMLPTDMLDYIR